MTRSKREILNTATGMDCFPSVIPSASPCALMEWDGGRLGISLHEGIGPAKGFDCGLLSLERG